MKLAGARCWSIPALMHLASSDSVGRGFPISSPLTSSDEELAASKSDEISAASSSGLLTAMAWLVVKDSRRVERVKKATSSQMAAKNFGLQNPSLGSHTNFVSGARQKRPCGASRHVYEGSRPAGNGADMLACVAQEWDLGV